jgi:hypothetical protein
MKKKLTTLFILFISLQFFSQEHHEEGKYKQTEFNLQSQKKLILQSKLDISNRFTNF